MRIPHPLRSLFLLPLALGLALAPLPAAAHDLDIAALVRENRDAVVSVRGVRKINENFQQGGGGQPPMPFPFDEFFPFPPEFFDRMPRRNQPVNSAGSGFIIDGEGYVMTNAHVVRGMDELFVTLRDEEEYPAELVGSDDKTDIALLKISADKPLPTAKIGDSEELQVGETVLAIGSPFGLGWSVTRGIISALGRRLPAEDFVPFIQTDAAVNPGNSGGPLMNARGEVIGINSQIFSRTGSFAGISFSIPINIAMDIQRKLRTHGVVQRGRLGVFFAPVTDSIAEAYGLENTNGALIQDVVENSPAQKAGLQSGDIILTYQGKPVEEAHTLPRMVGNTNPGTQVQLGVLRDGAMLEVTAVLSSLESNVPPSELLGLVVEDLTAEQRRRAGTEFGVAVSGVENTQNTPAEMVQLRGGDIITHVLVNQRRQRVDDRDTLITLLRGIEDGAIAFWVWRDGRRLVIPVKIDG